MSVKLNDKEMTLDEFEAYLKENNGLIHSCHVEIDLETKWGSQGILKEVKYPWIHRLVCTGYWWRSNGKKNGKFHCCYTPRAEDAKLDIANAHFKSSKKKMITGEIFGQ